MQLPWAKRKDRELIELKDLGLKIHADNRLEERIKQIELLHLAIEGNLNLPLEEEAPEFKVVQEIHELLESADPGNKIMGLKKQLNLLDRILRTAAIPWLRAGDGTVTARILHGWEGLYSKTKGVINSVENIIRRGEEGNIIQRLVDKSELVEKLENFLNVEVYRYGLQISSVSYRDLDVRPSHVTVLHQPPIGIGGSVWPTSQRPLGMERPPARPFPPKLDGDGEARED